MLIAPEDRLSEACVRRLAAELRIDLSAASWIPPRGQPWLAKKSSELSRTARAGVPTLIVTDLDAGPCAPALIGDWFRGAVPDRMLFVVAIREVEAWLLGDSEALANHLKVHIQPLEAPEALADPKRLIVELAAKSRSRRVREDVAVGVGAIRRVGPAYNDVMAEFVREEWRHDRAAERCPSLRRFLRRFPEWAS